MSVALLVLVIIASVAIVRIGAVLLEMTGIEWEQAKFQSLSAFTNSGFTTREAEDVVKHPVRRRIVSFLIVTGNAGIVTTIGAFAGSLVGGDSKKTLMNVGIVLAVILFVTWLARRGGMGTWMRVRLEKWLASRYNFQAPTAEEMLRLGEGYGLSRITVPKNSPVVGKLLKDLDLKRRMVQILAIERGTLFMPIPDGDYRLQAGDKAVVYGVGDSIDSVFHSDAAERLSIMLDVEGRVSLSALRQPSRPG